MPLTGVRGNLANCLHPLIFQTLSGGIGTLPSRHRWRVNEDSPRFWLQAGWLPGFVGPSPSTSLDKGQRIFSCCRTLTPAGKRCQPRFLVSDGIIFEHAASHDEQIALVEGAVHGLTRCRPCERKRTTTIGRGPSTPPTAAPRQRSRAPPVSGHHLSVRRAGRRRRP